MALQKRTFSRPTAGTENAESMLAQARDIGPSPRAAGRYTGVVVIHGIGDEKRNETLQEALNSLTYWFNHKAGLALRPQGAGRVWVRTQLTIDDDPDAPASRATLELEPPADGAANGDGDASPLRLELREVWWAQSFGLPKIGQAIKWARLQFREQASHILLPIGRRPGPSRAARHAPSRETAQALTYRPLDRAAADTPDANTSRAKADAAKVGAAKKADTPDVRLRRLALTTALWVYDLIQYVWKLAQWLVLIPLITLLLVLVSLLRLLAFIPFVRSTLLTAINGIVNYLVLHWIASMQVYLLDYTRSSAIRQLFEREVEAFLGDPNCQRIVVIAHSMGTVISYEGLTTLLAWPEWQDNQKPITYICLAQALRRIWLLQRTDTERLRAVLPERVRWLHFWARYDPVAVGPLSPRALPRLDRALDPSGVDPYAELCASLARCENVDVVNTDSSFADHTTYWRNLEQVVGPIARELVVGHPALEAVVREHLATPDEVLARRWSVGWRSLVAMAGGFGLAALLLVLDARNNGGVGGAVISLVGSALGSDPVQTFLRDNIPFYISIRDYLASGNQLQSVGQLLKNPILLPYLLSYYLTAENLATALTAVLAVGVGMWLTGKLVAAPTPFAFQEATTEARARRSVFTLAALSLGLLYAGFLILVMFLPQLLLQSNFDPHNAPFLGLIALIALGISEVLGLATLLAALYDALRYREWVWAFAFLAMPIVLLMEVAGTFPLIFFYSGIFNFDSGILMTAILEVVIVGCLAALLAALRQRQWSQIGSLLLAALVIGAVFVSTLSQEFSLWWGPALVVPLAFIAALAYGLRVGPYRLLQSGQAAGGTGGRRIAGVLVIASLVAVTRFLLGNSGPLWLLVVLAAAVWMVSLVTAVRARQWVWVAALPLLALLTLDMFVHFFVQIDQSNFLGLALSPEAVQAQVRAFLAVLTILALLTSASSYSLWGGARNVLPAPQPHRLPIGASVLASRPVFAALTAILIVASLALTAQVVIPLATFHVTLPGDVSPSGNYYDTCKIDVGLGAAHREPHSITVGPDGALWFREYGAYGIGQITPDGKVIEFAVSTRFTYPCETEFFIEDGEGIAAGPDGALWFTEPLGGSIARMTPDGTVREFALPGGDTLNPNVARDPIDITAGPDGTLWFTEGLGQIGRITPDGTVREFAGASGRSITTGPDGALWFTDPYSSRILRIIPDGTLREFALPTPGSEPAGITAGPDGALWFTERAADRIGRITPDGAVREFALPTPKGKPDGITAGPDGALWFTEAAAGRVGRITPDGNVREFALPTPDSGPQGITAGPDGALWFTERVGDRIGRITPDGTVREFPLPTSSSASLPTGPYAIAAGPDGALWFTELYANQIGRITPDGAMREFAVPAADGLTSIVAGPDGALWFTEYNANQIGRITPDGAIKEFRIPTHDSRPWQITKGPNSTLWFTQKHADASPIGRIRPDGTIEEFSLPAGSDPSSITGGPDGNIWFTDLGCGCVSKLVPLPSAHPVTGG